MKKIDTDKADNYFYVGVLILLFILLAYTLGKEIGLL